VGFGAPLASLGAAGGKYAGCQQGREEQLIPDRQAARAVPATFPMKQLRAAGAGEANKVFDVGHARGNGPDGCCVCDATSSGDEADHEHAARNLDATFVNVLVRDTIAGEMKRNAEDGCGSPRADDGAQCCSCRRMQRTDHRGLVAPAHAVGRERPA